MQKRAITPFKVIEVGTNLKPVCNFLLVINSNLTTYLLLLRSYHSLLFKFWTVYFLEPPFGGLRDNVRCSFGLTGKHVRDFLLVIIELFR